jgi:hypothetical protein
MRTTCPNRKCRGAKHPAGCVTLWLGADSVKHYNVVPCAGRVGLGLCACQTAAKTGKHGETSKEEGVMVHERP